MIKVDKVKKQFILNYLLRRATRYCTNSFTDDLKNDAIKAGEIFDYVKLQATNIIKY